MGVRFVYWLAVLILGLMYASTVTAQRACEVAAGNPQSYQIDPASNAVVIDQASSLMWMRCAVDQQWAIDHCDRQGGSYTYREALDYISSLNRRGGAFGFTDWRLPTVTELLGTVVSGCWSPALDTMVFPQAPVTGYWTATSDPDYTQGAMLVHFVNGQDYMGNRSVAWSIRLVRDHNKK